MATEAMETVRRIVRGKREIGKAVSYAVGHRIRCEILAALHEWPMSVEGLARIVNERTSTVEHHVKELLADGWIEIARSERIRGNIVQNYYCCVKLPEFSPEELDEMTEDERQALAGLIVQASTAEALASLWAGKLRNDRRVFLAWNRITLDEQGRDDLYEEQERSWRRKHEIEAESANRRAGSGEEGTTMVIASLGFERSRKAAPEPLTTGN